MRSYFSLTKTFLKAVEMSKGQDKKRKALITFLALFAAIFIMLPACIIAFTVMGMMTFSLKESGSQALGVELMLHVITIFTIIFGMNVVLNEFYFSNDIQFLIPWPLRASKIIASKFTAAFCVENVMQILLVASCLAGFGVVAQIGTANWLYSLIGIFTLPILPMAYCGIISILIMGFTRFIKNKDTMQRFSLGFIVILLLGFVVFISSLKELDMNAYVDAMVSGDQSFFKVMDCIFPNVYFFTRFFTEGNWLDLLYYVLVSLGAVAVMLLLAEGLYFKGVLGLSSGSSKKNKMSLSYLIDHSKQTSPWKAYFMKEVRILVRTPTFFTHCILSNFIWPLFVFAAYELGIQTLTVADIFPHAPNGSDPISLSVLKEAYLAGNPGVILSVIIGVISLSLIVSSINSISSSAISREGKHFAFMKYIPVSYELQWQTKLLVGILFPASSFFLLFWPACILFGLPLWHILLYSILSLATMLLPAFTGICIDASQPKLIWDDELNALRENYNNFFAMAISIGFAVLLGFGCYALYHYMNCNLLISGLIVFFAILALNSIFFAVARKTVTKNLQTQEEA